MMEKDRMKHKKCNNLHEIVQNYACKYLHLLIPKNLEVHYIF
jgi:hypothetical protein